MLIMSNAMQADRHAGQRCIENVPCSICVPVAGVDVSVAVNSAIPATDVSASVFLCALHHLLALSLAGFMALLSLTLTGLTGLTALTSLVGPAMERTINTA